MGKVKDFTGEIFYNMKALKFVGKDKWGHSIYLFECQLCGKKIEKVANEVKRGKCKSCGCNQNKATTIHGMTSSKIHQRWRGMKARCYNKNHKAYARYGGRGIKVCERWLNSFSNFLEDMGYPPFNNAQLDRIDVNDDYKPNNVRWVTPLQNANNKDINETENKSGFKNITYYRGKYKVVIARNYKRHYLGLFPTIDEAVKVRNEWLKNNDIV